MSDDDVMIAVNLKLLRGGRIEAEFNIVGDISAGAESLLVIAMLEEAKRSVSERMRRAVEPKA